MSILVVTPTRSRPYRALETYLQFESTLGRMDTECLWVLDANDPQLLEYYELSNQSFLWTKEYTGNMVERSNLAAKDHHLEYDIIGWGSDDLVPRTDQWDKAIEKAFSDGALMVGINDKHYGSAKLQTAFFSRDALDRLGFLCLPVSQHLYIDDYFTDLSRELGDRFTYLPDVVWEHVHPSSMAGSGTIPWDQQYRDIHQHENYTRDKIAYEKWVAEEMSTDVRRIINA